MPCLEQPLQPQMMHECFLAQGAPYLAPLQGHSGAFRNDSEVWSYAMQVGKGKVVKVTGIENPGRSATVLLRGSNKLVLEVTNNGY